MFWDYKIVVINCCDDKFESIRKLCSESALKEGGADEVIEYTLEMIDSEFREKNHEILSTKRGAGLWLWKPYFIKKTLERMNDNDFLFYSDAGVIFQKPIKLLIPSLIQSGQDIMAFELPLLEQEWTKNETQTFILGTSERKYSDNQILATYILFRNTPFIRGFIDKWLDYMQHYCCCKPENITGEPNASNFIEHREDQSVFSILCKSNNIKPFKDPSQFGIRPYEYAWRQSYQSRWKKYSYSAKTHKNSKYPQIILLTRKGDPLKMRKTENLKNLLAKIGIYNKYTFKAKYDAFLDSLPIE